ncbi:ferritin [Ferrigenium kumadai]|uniref:Ferritin n=1 Tax=Ferrigenium kumadai TaxID=1682490 RepID=A0AAN1SZM7_9PROT|nr:ferritin [Ferrigenium kumadai]BBI99908.1 ferritin [Ferrigenium kumadai]
MSHEGLHEREEKLAIPTVDAHRAILSLMEEFEAVDWYHQRADACTDAELRDILLHNMHEEMEHAAMLLEWLRRSTPRLDEILRTYLFTQGDLTRLEEKNKSKIAGDSLAQSEGGTRRMTVGHMKGA